MAEIETSRSEGPSAPSTTNRRSEPYIRISVTSPQKIRDFLFSYVSYRVTTMTNFSGFESECTVVNRRYRDFLQLYKKLVEKYQHEGRIVLPPPGKDFGGMMSVMLTDEDAVISMTFVRTRMFALERFLNRLAQHPIFRQETLFRDFLQVKTEFRRTLSIDAGEQRDGRGSLGSLNDSALFRARIEESDEWFRRKPEMLDSFQHQLKKFWFRLKDVIAQRRCLSMATAHMARSLNMLSCYENNLPLASTLVAAADLQENIEQLHETQACSEDMLLPELIKDYIRFTDFIKAVFDERAITTRRLYDAEKELERKQTAERKAIENSSSPAEIANARKERRQWKDKVQRHTQICSQLSTTLREETDHYEKVRAAEFRAAFIKGTRIYVETLEQMTNNCKEFLIKEDP